MTRCSAGYLLSPLGTFSLAILLYLYVTHVLNSDSSLPSDMLKNLYYICQSGADLIMNAINPIPLATINSFSNPLLTPDWAGLLILFVLLTFEKS
jgi:hypothetical protein